MEKLLKILVGLMLILFQLYYLLPNYIVIVLKIAIPLIVLLLHYHLNKEKKIKNMDFLIWFFTFFLVGIISIFYTVSDYESLDVVISLISSFLTLFVISQFIKNEKDIDYIVSCLIIGGLIYAMYILVRQGSSILDGINAEYAGGTGMLFSYIVTPTIIYVVWRIFYSKNYKMLYISSFCLLYFLSLMSGGKKTFMIPLIFIAVLVFLKFKKSLIKISIGMTFLIILTYYLYDIAMKNQKFYDILGIRIESFLNYFTQNGRVDGSTRERVALIDESWDVFLNNPLKGVGIGAFKELSSSGLYSHNNYLELLTGVGIIGFMIFYMVYLYLVPKLMKISFYSNEKYSNLLLAFLIINLIQDIGTVSYYRTTFLIPICLSYCYIRLYKEKNIGNERKLILNEKHLHSKQ